jgi:hypothetical protein
MTLKRCYNKPKEGSTSNCGVGIAGCGIKTGEARDGNK